jgi:hypothetical protein
MSRILSGVSAYLGNALVNQSLLSTLVRGPYQTNWKESECFLILILVIWITDLLRCTMVSGSDKTYSLGDDFSRYKNNELEPHLLKLFSYWISSNCRQHWVETGSDCWSVHVQHFRQVELLPKRMLCTGRLLVIVVDG